jgi:hypothetical protein
VVRKVVLSDFSYTSFTNCSCSHVMLRPASHILVAHFMSISITFHIVPELDYRIYIKNPFLIRCRTMDGPKVNAGGKLVGSPTTTSRNGSVCLQVKSAKFSKSSAEPCSISPGLYTVCCLCLSSSENQRRSVILLKAACWVVCFCLAALIVQIHVAGTEYIHSSVILSIYIIFFV